MRPRRAWRSADRILREHRSVRFLASRRMMIQRRHHRIMVAEAAEGNDVVCASRFMAGGSMVGCPWLKAVLVRTWFYSLRSRAPADP